MRSFLWRRPEWWTIALSIVCWIFLILQPFASQLGHHHGHDAGTSYLQVLHWQAMVAAMMLPLLIGQIRVVASRSLWRRRNWAIVLYLTGYLMPWFVYGAIAVSVLQYLRSPYTTAISLLIAALWQLTWWKRNGLIACHRTEPLAPSGRVGRPIATACAMDLTQLAVAL